MQLRLNASSTRPRSWYRMLITGRYVGGGSYGVGVSHTSYGSALARDAVVRAMSLAVPLSLGRAGLSALQDTRYDG